jgi:phospholipid/cholesterol/gamma-HCH transport system permease protein
MATAAETSDQTATLTTRREDGLVILEPGGDWLIGAIGRFDSAIRKIEEGHAPDSIRIDLSNLGRIDTAGAYLLGRAVSRCGDPDGDWHYLGGHESARALLADMRRRLGPGALRCWRFRDWVV